MKIIVLEIIFGYEQLVIKLSTRDSAGEVRNISDTLCPRFNGNLDPEVSLKLVNDSHN